MEKIEFTSLFPNIIHHEMFKYKYAILWTWLGFVYIGEILIEFVLMLMFLSTTNLYFWLPIFKLLQTVLQKTP